MKRVARALAESKIDFARTQDWTSGGADFFYGKGNKNHHLGAIFFVHKTITFAFMRGEFVSDRSVKRSLV